MTVRRPLVWANDTATYLAAADSLDVVQACDASATSITTTTLANVAGCAFALEAGRTYVFDWDVAVSQTVLLGTVQLGLAFSGTPASVWFSDGSAILQALPGTFSYAVAVAAVGVRRIVGRVRATTAGNLTLQGARSGGTTTLIGAIGRLIRV